MSPGEEVPHPDRGEELPEAQQQHERGEEESYVTSISQPEEKYSKMKLLPSKYFFLNLDELFKQDFLHISEPDLVYADGPPHSPSPSSASVSSSSSPHVPSPELCPVRPQEVKSH